MADFSPNTGDWKWVSGDSEQDKQAMSVICEGLIADNVYEGKNVLIMATSKNAWGRGIKGSAGDMSVFLS